MDTRFWGPSGWQLFHLIAFRSPNAKDVMEDMPYVLPCKFCRASTQQFVKEHPPRGDLGKWLYEIHNMVNDKLRTQCANDPKVINPGPDPEFDDVKQRYQAMKPSSVPGRDFLMAVAYNYPATPTAEEMETQQRFLSHLRKAFPFKELRKIFNSYAKPSLQSQRAYTHWMYGLMKLMSVEVNTEIRSYAGYMSHLSYYKSGCAKKTYKGKTCRRTAGGGHTKDRDSKRTRRVVSRSLLV
jgi:hypothetical protein